MDSVPDASPPITTGKPVNRTTRWIGALAIAALVLIGVSIGIANLPSGEQTERVADKDGSANDASDQAHARKNQRSQKMFRPLIRISTKNSQASRTRNRSGARLLASRRVRRAGNKPKLRRPRFWSPASVQVASPDNSNPQTSSEKSTRPRPARQRSRSSFDNQFRFNPLPGYRRS